MTRRHTLEAHQRYFGHEIRHDCAHPTRPAPNLVEYAAERVEDRMSVVNVGIGQRGNERAGGELLARARDHDRAAAA